VGLINVLNHPNFFNPVLGGFKDFVRLTHFNDYVGWKSSNPVISSDGKMMGFQIAHTADEAGVGYVLVLHKF
jgi:hypothetical protein